MKHSPIAFLSLGSNLGDRIANLKAAVADLGAAGTVIRRISSVYETEPVGYLDQPWFLNIALALETSLAPRELLGRCLEIEAVHGRVRSFRGAPRTLDVDILLIGDLVVNEPGLTIPHPRMAERRFVLAPLAEIAPDVLHPVCRQTIGALLKSCADASRVARQSDLI